MGESTINDNFQKLYQRVILDALLQSYFLAGNHVPQKTATNSTILKRDPVPPYPRNIAQGAVGQLDLLPKFRILGIVLAVVELLLAKRSFCVPVFP